MPAPMYGAAHIEGDLRMTLTRQWGKKPGKRLAWMMLNPSTADGSKNDNTLTRIIAFSQRWGYDGLYVVNLLPFRSPSPAELNEWYKSGAWTTEAHLRHVRFVAEVLNWCGGDVIAAWGAGMPKGFDHRRILGDLTWMMNNLRVDLNWRCIGRTAGGFPTHPLARGKHRVADDVVPIPYDWRDR